MFKQKAVQEDYESLLSNHFSDILSKDLTKYGDNKKTRKETTIALDDIANGCFSYYLPKDSKPDKHGVHDVTALKHVLKSSKSLAVLYDDNEKKGAIWGFAEVGKLRNSLMHDAGQQCSNQSPNDGLTIISKFFDEIQEYIKQFDGKELYIDNMTKIRKSLESFIKIRNTFAVSEKPETLQDDSGIGTQKIESEPSLEVVDLDQQFKNTQIAENELDDGATEIVNPINYLQEECVKKGVFPRYEKVLDEDIFHVKCTISGTKNPIVTEKSDKNEKIARSQAAKEALEKLTGNIFTWKVQQKQEIAEVIQFFQNYFAKVKATPIKLAPYPKAAFNNMKQQKPDCFEVEGLELTRDPQDEVFHCDGTAKMHVKIGDKGKVFEVEGHGTSTTKKMAESNAYADILENFYDYLSPIENFVIEKI